MGEEILTFSASDSSRDYSYHFVGQSFYKAVQHCNDEYFGGTLVYYQQQDVMKFIINSLPSAARFNFWVPFVKRRSEKSFSYVKVPFSQLPTNDCSGVGYSVYNGTAQTFVTKCNYISTFICQRYRASTSAPPLYQNIPGNILLNNNSNAIGAGAGNISTSTPANIGNAFQLNALGTILLVLAIVLLLALLVVLILTCCKQKLFQRQNSVTTATSTASSSYPVSSGSINKDLPQASTSYVNNVGLFGLTAKSKSHDETGYYSIRNISRNNIMIEEDNDSLYNDVGSDKNAYNGKPSYINAS